MDVTPGAPVGPPTNSPPIASGASPSRSLTPVEYGAIGVGAVMILAILACIYRKYKQCKASSSGGSYSPISGHKKPPERKMSEQSKEEGQPPEIKEVDKTTSSPVEPNEPKKEIVVVEVNQEDPMLEEVVETPITKTVVNGLQKSSVNQHTISVQPQDSVEVISETQKSSMEKPPRKTKTPNASPEKFTSDKTSASNLNEDSLKTVSHAIGGILRSQAPTEEKTENPSNGQTPEEESVEGVHLLGKMVGIVETPKLDNHSGNSTHEDTSQSLEVDKPQGDAALEVPSKNEPLCISVEEEQDVGSEYYSADENSDSRSSPPLSPTPGRELPKNVVKSLRAEDVYNTEITTEDGRRRSIEEDIAESLQTNEEGNPPNVNEAKLSPSSDIKESSEPSAPPVNEETQTGSITEPLPNTHCSMNEVDTTKDVNVQNLENTEEIPREVYEKKEAEAIIDDIIRTSCLDPVVIESIRQDLGSTQVPTGESSEDTKMNNNLHHGTKVRDLDSYTWSGSQTDIGGGKQQSLSNNFLQEVIHNAEPIVGESQNVPENARNEVNAELTNQGATNHQDVNAEIFVKSSINPLYNNVPTSANITNQTGQQASRNQVHIVDMQNIDEGFPADHRFERIPPKQPGIYEDDLIVFSNSDQESVTPISNSHVDLNSLDKERCEKVDNGNIQDQKDVTRHIQEEKGRMSVEEVIVYASGSSEEHSKSSSEHNRTKWYVPSDEISDADLLNDENKTGGDLYIVLTDEVPKPLPQETAGASTNQALDGSPRKPKKEVRHHSNISYAYIDVNGDPTNEGWPEHLPKNIHSISGIGLVKTSTTASSLYGALREEELEALPSTSEHKNSDDNKTDYSTMPKQKPIPKFIIPNMDGRLSKKRTSRRRQIKSLDSGLHHYYGEYLNLEILPEIDSEHGESNKNEIKKENVSEEVIEEVLTIKPDGTMTEEKIVIQSSQ